MEDLVRMYAMSDGDPNGEPTELDPDRVEEFSDEDEEELETAGVHTSSDDDVEGEESVIPAEATPSSNPSAKRSAAKKTFAKRAAKKAPAKKAPAKKAPAKAAKKATKKVAKRSAAKRANPEPGAEGLQPRKLRPSAPENPLKEVIRWQLKRQQKRQPRRQ